MGRALSERPPVAFRAVTEADHALLARRIFEWWDERPPHVDRLWFRHFATTSIVGESDDGPVAIVIGFLSPTVPGRGVLSLVAVARRQRRQGVGRAAAAALVSRLRGQGATVVEATVWPGNRVGVRFLEGLGFAPAPESIATPLFGVPAFADYDGEGEDRSLFTLGLPPA